MKKILNAVKKVFLVIYLLFIHALAFIFLADRYIKPYFNLTETENVQIGSPTAETPIPTPQTIPPDESLTGEPASNGAANNTQSDVNAAQLQDNTTNQAQNNASASDQTNQTSDAPNTLMIPVASVKREQLRDTYNDARSENRVHNAIDIMAAGGTPVVAAADGEIAKFFDSERGGITIYQYSSDRKFAYYYAHLQRRADNLKEKDVVKRGTVIGYVGDTGNAGAGNYHLHFTVTTLADGQNYWQGTDINPYPLLKVGLESR